MHVAEQVVHIPGETPADVFYHVEMTLDGMEDVREDWFVSRSPFGKGLGDVVCIDLSWTNPEGRQVDVDRFAPAHCVSAVELDFGIEIEVED